jgi:hypothetical protein
MSFSMNDFKLIKYYITVLQFIRAQYSTTYEINNLNKPTFLFSFLYFRLNI